MYGSVSNVDDGSRVRRKDMFGAWLGNIPGTWPALRCSPHESHCLESDAQQPLVRVYQAPITIVTDLVVNLPLRSQWDR